MLFLFAHFLAVPFIKSYIVTLITLELQYELLDTNKTEDNAAYTNFSRLSMAIVKAFVMTHCYGAA